MARWLQVVIATVVIVLLVLAYGGMSSIRYGLTDRQRERINKATETADVAELNRLLVELRSPVGKTIVMYWIDQFSDSSSLPALVKTLSYDLSWLDRLDSELRPTPDEVRFSAYDSIVKYGPERAADIVYPLLQDKNQFTRLYAAGIILRWGDPRGETVLDEIIASGGKRHREEAEWVKMVAKRGK